MLQRRKSQKVCGSIATGKMQQIGKIWGKFHTPPCKRSSLTTFHSWSKITTCLPSSWCNLKVSHAESWSTLNARPTPRTSSQTELLAPDLCILSWWWNKSWMWWIDHTHHNKNSHHSVCKYSYVCIMWIIIGYKFIHALVEVNCFLILYIMLLMKDSEFWIDVVIIKVLTYYD